MDLCRSPIISLVIAKLSRATTSPHTSSTSYTPLNPIVNRQHTFLTKVDHKEANTETDEFRNYHRTSTLKLGYLEIDHVS